MTTQKEFLGRLIQLLDEAGIPSMVAGSVGSSVHGRPRATHGADVVIDPTADQLESLITLLEQGCYVNRDTARDALRRRTMFNIVDLDGGWKAGLIIRKDRPFSRQEFQRRRQIDAMGEMLWVISPEDAILSKLEWMKGRESDVQYSDAVGVAAAQWGNLDMEYLRKWAEDLGVRDRLIELLEQARTESEQCDRGV